ncbi:ankyrin-1-like [Lolium rigidum]|uniref:ankyrin-1-like n=1 Tax=Lolium rigidum TaxID=89674 RepID=UPI001F5DBA0C|nr:ankyrin-1-like [Lolium rigidum]
MTRPSHEIGLALGTPQKRLLVAATAGDLALLERTARKLDDGRGRLAEAVESVKDHGVGALHLAAAFKKAEVCEYLVEDVRVDVDALDINGRTPLVWAITCKGGRADLDIVRYLLDHGANPDNVDKSGFTPLHEATKAGHCEVVELLLSRGVYVDPFSTEHGTPLHVAAIHKQDGAMKILLDHHADPNKILGCFSTPLMLAMCSHSVKCVNLLIEAGADVKGMRTTTPLQAAARNGLTDVLKTLLDAGADPNVRNEFGHLPIQIAACFGTREDVEILFEVTTSRIEAVHDWSVDGIISYIKSEPKLEDNPLSKMSVAKLKEEGNKALDKDDYDAALKFYNMAMMVNTENLDVILIGNRGFCRLHVGNGEGALNDAQFCRTMQPDSAHPCWLQGYSYVQLQEYEKACDAFLDGLKLKPGFTGIEKALREALRLLKESHADKKNGLEVQYREAHVFL